MPKAICSIQYLLLILCVHEITSERCPPVFGEFECPAGTLCQSGQCLTTNNQLVNSCETAICSDENVCVDGKCYPLSTVKCNRHVLTADGEARSIVSDCGPKAKCVNGQCKLDKCLNVDCGDGELCRDGRCVNLVDQFCVGHGDCGAALECRSNKCVIPPMVPQCNCDPSQLCSKGECIDNSRCANIYCPSGHYCVDGTCISGVGASCTDDVCHGDTVCVQGRCEMDPCNNKCPADNDCRLGECRALQGLPCQGECPTPFECIDGACTRNECALKVCQLGETCEGLGSCVRVAGRFCTLAIRDCGVAFDCLDNKCVDKLGPTTNSG